MYFSENDFHKIQEWLKLHSIKDTEFPSATVPLSGYEKLAIVQKGENKTVSLYNILSALGAGLQYEVLPLEDYLKLEEKDMSTLYFCIEQNDEGVEEINKMFLGIKAISPTTNAKEVMIATKTLYEVLGVKDSSTSTTNAVSPTLTIYNPITNTYQGSSTTTVEYGTRVINKSNPLRAIYSIGSAGNFENLPVFRITQGETSEIVETETVVPATTTKGFQYISKNPVESYTVGVNSIIQLTLQDQQGNTAITTPIGQNTVTRTTSLNVVAEHLLTAQNTPYVIDGPEVITTEEDYPSKTLSCTLTFAPFKYMYIHRNTEAYTSNYFHDTIGKHGYVQRRQGAKSSWTINNTTSVNQYYAVLIPSEIVLSRIYTTFLGNDSEVAFTELGKTMMEGATNTVSAYYTVYATKQPVAFGDGTMTFIFN